ncbi:outer membrane beta-barrel protein [Paraferrimonas haliotis]|uniref:PhoP/Q and low Mg2+ inducible outer membrane protein H1 n=1 Tax=Paraferrimonas haliotis TaxID=2013866 RepID=A0AA37TRH3_9GAMM|nr:outer membrane beta-barrel protein [Paraferrimonas haliotis]GLS84338.1 PhoP/Q and low Mg2+ inducible outer membrane protein H1 [Paraferrimonas haliotis]
MKKLTLAALATSTCLAATPALATEFFIGGNLGVQQNSFDYKTHNMLTPAPANADINSGSTSERDGFYELKAGMYFGDATQHRATLSYSVNDGKIHSLNNTKFEQRNILASYDYLIPLSADNRLSAFIGATIGSANSKVHTADVGSSNDFVYGGQVGLNYRVTQAVSAELGYRYLKQDYSSSTLPEVSPTSFDYAAFDINNSQQLYLGVDYRF